MLLLAALLALPAPQASCYRANSDTVILSGIIGQRTFSGAPNYTSVKAGDARESSLFLSLREAICSRDDEVAGPKKNVRLVQLVLDSAGNASLRTKLGQSVRLRGTLFGAHTGHHHADLLLSVLSPVPVQK